MLTTKNLVDKLGLRLVYGHSRVPFHSFAWLGEDISTSAPESQRLFCAPSMDRLLYECSYIYLDEHASIRTLLLHHREYGRRQCQPRPTCQSSQGSISSVSCLKLVTLRCLCCVPHEPMVHKGLDPGILLRVVSLQSNTVAAGTSRHHGFQHCEFHCCRLHECFILSTNLCQLVSSVVIVLTLGRWTRRRNV